MRQARNVSRMKNTILCRKTEREGVWTGFNWNIPTNHKKCSHWTTTFGDLIHYVILLAMCTVLFTATESCFIICHSCRLYCSSVWCISLRVHCTSREAVTMISLHFHIRSWSYEKSEPALLHKSVLFNMSVDTWNLFLCSVAVQFKKTSLRSALR
jgi:hypothetical protein